MAKNHQAQRIKLRAIEKKEMILRDDFQGNEKLEQSLKRISKI